MNVIMSSFFCHTSLYHFWCYCAVPKRFRIKLLPGTSVQGMKLNKKRMHWLANQKKKEVTSEAVARDMKLSKTRVEQIWKKYRETGKILW